MDLEFPTVTEMLRHYESNPLRHTYKNIGVPVAYKLGSDSEVRKITAKKESGEEIVIITSAQFKARG